MISSTVRVKVQENSSPKAITHMIDLEQVLPEVEIERFKVFSLHKKSGFPLRISSVNVIKSTGNCGFGHIY